MPHFDNTRVTKIARADVQALVKEIVDTGAGASTVDYAIGILRRNWMRHWQLEYL